jgi:hypothetical protein
MISEYHRAQVVALRRTLLALPDTKLIPLLGGGVVFLKILLFLKLELSVKFSPST